MSTQSAEFVQVYGDNLLHKVIETGIIGSIDFVRRDQAEESVKRFERQGLLNIRIVPFDTPTGVAKF